MAKPGNKHNKEQKEPGSYLDANRVKISGTGTDQEVIDRTDELVKANLSTSDISTWNNLKAKLNNAL